MLSPDDFTIKNDITNLIVTSNNNKYIKEIQRVKTKLLNDIASIQQILLNTNSYRIGEMSCMSGNCLVNISGCFLTSIYHRSNHCIEIINNVKEYLESISNLTLDFHMDHFLQGWIVDINIVRFQN